MHEPTRQRRVATGPLWLWLALAGFAALIAVLVILDGPVELKVAAGWGVFFIGLPILGVLLLLLNGRRVVGAFRAASWDERTAYAPLAFYALIVFLGLYVGVGYGVPTAALGPGWPVNAWRDLLAEDRILIDLVEDKKREMYTTGSSGSREVHYRHSIRVGGQNWSVSEKVYNLVARDEVVEIAYKPYTKFVLYIAYGPGLSLTRSTNELRVAVALDPAEREVFEELILPGFKDQTGIEITFVQMEPGTLQEILRKGLGSPFDLLVVDNNQLGSLVEHDLVQDLSVEVDFLPPEVLRYAPIPRFDDQYFFFPFRPNVMVTYYDEEELQRLGLEPPRTWDELYAVAKAFVDGGAGKRVVLQGCPGPPNATQIVEFIWQAGGDPMALNDDGSRQAFAFLQRLYPYLSNKTQEAKFDTVNEYLLSGDAYLAPNWTFGVSEVVVKGGKTDIKVFSGWRGPEDEAHVLGGDVLAIPSRSDKRDKALQFAQYLLSKEVQSILADQLFWPSAREDAYEGIDPELRPYWDSINEALAKARARPTVPYWGEVEEILTQAWDDIVVQGMDVSSRLDHYAERLEKVRK